MTLKHGILGLLKAGAMTGYDLDRTFKKSLSFLWHAQTSQIYRELDTMEKRGWVVSERVVQDDKPNKRVYSLTQAGVEELQDWLSNPGKDIADALTSRNPFLMRLFFSGEIGEEQTVLMLKKYRQECIAFLASFEDVYQEIERSARGELAKEKKYWALTARYGEMLGQTALEWAEESIKVLKEENEHELSKN